MKSQRQSLVCSSVAFFVLMAGLTALPGPARAAPCQSQYLDKIIEKYNGECRALSACWTWRMGKLAAYPSVQMRKVGVEMSNWWNVMVGNSWARLGPRKFEFGLAETGNVVTPGKRTFVSLLPSGDDTRTVTITKTGGKSRTVVRVCKADPVNGRPAQVGSTKEFAKKARNGTSHTFSVTGANRQFIIVEIIPKTAGRSMNYKLMVR